MRYQGRKKVNSNNNWEPSIENVVIERSTQRIFEQEKAIGSMGAAFAKCRPKPHMWHNFKALLRHV